MGLFELLDIEQDDFKVNILLPMNYFGLRSLYTMLIYYIPFPPSQFSLMATGYTQEKRKYIGLMLLFYYCSF